MFTAEDEWNCRNYLHYSLASAQSHFSGNTLSALTTHVIMTVKQGARNGTIFFHLDLVNNELVENPRST